MDYKCRFNIILLQIKQLDKVGMNKKSITTYGLSSPYKYNTHIIVTTNQAHKQILSWCRPDDRPLIWLFHTLTLDSTPVIRRRIRRWVTLVCSLNHW